MSHWTHNGHAPGSSLVALGFSGQGGTAMPGSGSMMRTANPIVPKLLMKPAIGAFAAARNWLISARGMVSTISGRLLGVMRGSKLFRSKEVMSMAKLIGIEATAVALGISAVEVAQLIAAQLTQTAGRRRGRGISARDVKVTRRTIGKIRSIERTLSDVCGPRTSRARKSRSTIPAAFVRQG